MTASAGIAGIILAGGLSRRMFPGRSGASADGALAGRSGASADAPGGGDKSLLDIAGKPMLAHVIERLRPQVGAMAINANGDPARFAAFGLPVVPDTIEGFVGPLAGVLAGMRWASKTTTDARWIASVSADAPLLPHDVVDRLRDAVETRGNSIAIAQSGGELHPVIGLWPVALADDLDAALRSGLRKVLHWTDRHGTVPVDFAFIDIAGRSVDPFFNANTPDELEDARALLAALSRI